MITKVNSRNQIIIPQAMLEKLNIKAGDSVLVDVQDSIMVLIPQPKRYTNHLQGLHSETWKTVDVENISVVNVMLGQTRQTKSVFDKR